MQASPSPTVPPSPTEPLLRISGLAVRYGGRFALRDVDMTVGPGEIVTLIGPNGAGKTTLVRAALGLVPVAAGHVWRRKGLRVGYMPQRIGIDPSLPLTVRRFLKVWGETDDRAIAAALEEVGAGAVAGRAIQSLSGGELQRVLLARALLRRPELLVLDEPVQAVDVQGQLDLFDLIAGIKRRTGCAVLMVSHDLHLVMARTDRVLCVNGHICCSGPPEAVEHHPGYLALFGPRAPALAVYRHHHDHDHNHAPDGCVLAPDETARGHPGPGADGRHG